MRILGNLSQAGRHGGTDLYLLNHFAGPRPYLLTILKAYGKTCQVYLDPAGPRALNYLPPLFYPPRATLQDFCFCYFLIIFPVSMSLSKTEAITHFILTKKAIKSDVKLKFIKYLRIFRRKSKHTKFWTNSGTNRAYIITYSALETAQGLGAFT